MTGCACALFCLRQIFRSKKLNDIFGSIINSPEFQARLKKAGFPCVYMDSAAFTQQMDNIAHTCSYLLQNQINSK